jgi:hypothetical protein
MIRRLKRTFRPSLAGALEDRMVPSHSGLLANVPTYIVAGPIPAPVEIPVPVLTKSTYDSLLAQIDSAFNADHKGGAGSAELLMQRVSGAILRLPLGTTLLGRLPGHPSSITAAGSSHLRDQIKREVRGFVRTGVLEGKSNWQGPPASWIHVLAPTGRLLPLPHLRGPIPVSPPPAMTPFLG